MIEEEVFKKIKPLLEGYTEGIYWDFKKNLCSKGDIIKDILAFSNSNHEEDSYIIVGVSEPENGDENKKIKLTTEDRRRLKTEANYLYLPGNWALTGLEADEIETLKKFSEEMTETIATSMLLSQPKCEFYPIQIKNSLWIYVIIVKNVPGVFISNKDIQRFDNNGKISVKQGVLYIRVADTTIIGAETKVASATEHIRVWRKYLDWLRSQDLANEEKN